MVQVLSADEIQSVLSNAYSQLQIPVSSTPEQIAQVFRLLCLQAIINPSSNASSSMAAQDPPTSTVTASEDSLHQFQKQAVAYRFLNSLPLLDNFEFSPHHILATLRPLSVVQEVDRHARASAMLDLHIATMEQAQRTWQLPYTNYVITVHYCLRKHVVRRRYKEFVLLHQALQEKLPVIPALPESHWYLKLAMPAERAKSLAFYLTRIITMLANRGLFSVEIMEFLEIDYATIRAQEEALATDYLSRSSAIGNSYYFIHAGWILSWRRFLAHPDCPVGAIRNDLLYEKPNELKENLQAAFDYRCVSLQVWNYLVLVYGGGPVIMRKTANIYSKHAIDNNTFAVLIQKIVRGFLGRVHAKQRKAYLATQDPVMEKHIAIHQAHQMLEERMEAVRKYVDIREFQVQHIAAMKIQRLYRAHLLRQEHDLLMKESAVPDVAHQFNSVEEYFSLEEIGMIADLRYRLAHFLLTMNKGVPIQKLRARWKTPSWRVFRINAIGSQLQWNTRKKTANFIEGDIKNGMHCMEFSNVFSVHVENPLRVNWLWSKSVLANKVVNHKKKQSKQIDFAVVIRYQSERFLQHEEHDLLSKNGVPNDPDPQDDALDLHEPPISPAASTRSRRTSLESIRASSAVPSSATTQDDNTAFRKKQAEKPSKYVELILACENRCDCEALCFGLRALVHENQTRIQRGASYVDGHGAIRKKVSHAKRLLKQAQELIEQQPKGALHMVSFQTRRLY